MPRIARDLLRVEPLTVAAETRLFDVLHLLVLARVSTMPVVEDGRVIGTLDASDVLSALDQLLHKNHSVADPVLLDHVSGLRAREIGTTQPIWIAADMSVKRIVEVMRTEGVRHVYVGTATRLEGILTAYDLLRRSKP
jgi:CBS domain-containing protein